MVSGNSNLSDNSILTLHFGNTYPTLANKWFGTEGGCLSSIILAGSHSTRGTGPELAVCSTRRVNIQPVECWRCGVLHVTSCWTRGIALSFCNNVACCMLSGLDAITLVQQAATFSIQQTLQIAWNIFYWKLVESHATCCRVVSVENHLNG